MRLTGLTIRAFRNLSALDLEVPPEGAVIIGGNGHGKTNLLEAIYYLVLFRSLRGAKDRELVRFGEAGFFVGGSAERRTDGPEEPRVGGSESANRRTAEPPHHRITAGYEPSTRRKKVTLDGVEVSRLSAAVGQMLAVPFSPADTQIVTGGPGTRRRYLDVMLSVSEHGYLSRLSGLRLALKQRNAALRHGRGDEAQGFERPLAEAAAVISLARRSWAERWSGRFSALNAVLGERASATMLHQSQAAPGEGPDAWLRLLAASHDRDLRRGATTTGPHRDDLRLTLGERDLGSFGSAGQQRTAAIALRLLEAETLTAAHGTAPVALYDDVFAELDGDRQGRLLRLIREVLPGQAFVVAPRDAEVPAGLFDRPRWQIRGGVIER